MKNVILSAPLMNWNRFSKSRKFFGTIAWVLRFIRNCKLPVDERKLGTLEVEELSVATRITLTLVQKDYYPMEYEALMKEHKKTCKIPLVQQLNLSLDQGVMICKGRMEFADMSDEAKFPILLPKNCPFSSVVVRECHIFTAHLGVNATTAEVRQRFWIPQIQQLVKSVLYHCVPYKKVHGKPFKTNVIPPLPEFRVQCNSPFNITGIDYTGALWVKGPNKQLVKAYIILFTCLITRAIHLEVVTDQSCDSFLIAFRRFCGRRGFPSLVLSDNATVFVSAADFLRNMQGL